MGLSHRRFSKEFKLGKYLRPEGLLLMACGFCTINLRVAFVLAQGGRAGSEAPAPPARFSAAQTKNR